MAIPRNQLGSGEYEIETLRTHVKRLIGPILLGLILLVAAAIGAVFLPQLADPAARPAIAIAVWLVALALLIPVTIVPWLRWLTTTYSITNRRIVTRTGVLTRRGHDLPLRSISDVSTERSLTDRLFNCGTLVLETSAETPLKLDDIPHVERVNTRISELLFGGSAAFEQGEEAHR